MFLNRVKGWLTPIAKMMVSMAVLWFLVHSAQIKLGLFISFFQRPLVFVSIVLMFLIMIVMSAWRWHALNSAQGIYLDFYNTALAAYLGGAFNNVLPGAIGGDIVRLYYVFKSVPEKKSHALLSIFSDRMMGFLAVFITICCVAASRMHQFSQQPRIFYLLAICTTFCIGVLLVFVICVWLSRYIGLSIRQSKRLSQKVWMKRIISLLDTINVFRIEKAVVIKCLLISVGMQLLIVETILMIGKMMGLPAIAFSDYIIAMGVTQVVNLIPITPGGVGIGEMAFANILSILNPGVSAAYATIFFAYRLISMLTYLPGIIWYIPKFILFKKRNNLQENIMQA